MTGDNLVSVVLPTFNRAHTLPRAITSVLAQTHANLELIVVDDGSVDGTRDLVAQYNDQRLRYIYCKQQRGAGAARNVGIREARGQYIAFQDSDDAWLIDKLRLQLSLLEKHPEKTACAGGAFFIKAGSNRVYYCNEEFLTKRRYNAVFFKHGHQIATPSWLVRREALARAGLFDESLRTWEDWELSIRLDKLGGFVLVDQPVYIAFESAGSVKFNVRAYAETLEAVAQRHKDDLIDTPRMNARRYYMCSQWERLQGHHRQARQWARKAVRENPLHLRAWHMYLRSFPVAWVREHFPRPQ